MTTPDVTEMPLSLEPVAPSSFLNGLETRSRDDTRGADLERPEDPKFPSSLGRHATAPRRRLKPLLPAAVGRSECSCRDDNHS
jgi:hypothetical protein